jgi:hypothetical protein
MTQGTLLFLVNLKKVLKFPRFIVNTPVIGDTGSANGQRFG